MDEKDKIIVGFITELLETTPDDYMEIKLILLTYSAGNPALTHFLQEVFKLIEARRPRLIEMQGSVIARVNGKSER